MKSRLDNTYLGSAFADLRAAIKEGDIGDMTAIQLNWRIGRIEYLINAAESWHYECSVVERQND